jgi:hypothetical protein
MASLGWAQRSPEVSWARMHEQAGLHCSPLPSEPAGRAPLSQSGRGSIAHLHSCGR